MDAFNKYKYSAIYGHILNWLAIYEDGTVQREFENEYVKNDFYQIDQEKIKYFGLYGKGNSYYFNKEGQFFLNDKLMEITYESGNKIHKLTNNETIKDLITFKKAYVEYDQQEGLKDEVSDGIAIGYKYKYEREELEMHVQIVVHIPYSSRTFPYVEIKLTPNQDLNGVLKINNEIKTVYETEAPMPCGYSGQINWVIKL